MVDIIEIYVHWYAGRSKSQVGASLGVDRKTVRKYLAPAEAAGIAPGGPPMGEADWAKLIKTWFPGQAERGLNQITWPEIDQHRDYIKTLLETTTVTTIHQRLRDERKLKASISSFRRWVHENLPDEAARSKVTVLRDDVEPGSEAQIDYGFLGQWINPGTGKRHRIWAFVMVLPCSRHMFVRPVIHMDQHAWTESHAEAFRFFGGVPRRLVPDNLRTGVDKPDLYDPKINKAYAELALYYGALVDPARAVHPKDKPRVERPMPYVRDSFWSGRQFTSLEHMQAEALVWAREIAGGRQCRPLGGAAPLAVFDAVEAPALLPLPDKPFVLARWSTAQGILGLRKKYSDVRLEAACAKALTVGDPSYRTIKGILIAGTETDPEPETGDAGAAAFLHGPEGLFPTDIPTQTLGGLHQDQGHDDAEETVR
ncbi:IS21 family transposase [Streptomyces mirabilis]|uniref:IS21 family transposase n=1 Tax=Streptomyces mirabilis TaxID=68239 RepID=UPI0022548EDA|nr:IS21 family transposase [Streptomyces mirabilis]MCX5346676.1 IS21 family transposase [Streptomyces mirabilis]